jgi:hypothetical protein
VIEALILELAGRIDALRSALEYAQTRLEKVNGTFEYLQGELPHEADQEGLDDGTTHAPPSEFSDEPPF